VAGANGGLSGDASFFEPFHVRLLEELATKDHNQSNEFSQISLS
jgi:hypothetical protein